MQIVLFEDSLVSQLEPITLLRPAYTLSCGSMSLGQWIQSLSQPVTGLVRSYLDDFQRAEFPTFSREEDTRRIRLVLNARLVPCPLTFDFIRQLLDDPQPGVVLQGETLVAAVVPADAPPIRSLVHAPLDTAWRESPYLASLPTVECPLPIFSYPHDLVRFHLDTLGDNLQLRLSSGRYREIRDGVFAAQNVELADWAHTDTSDGPIVLETGAVVRPFACLRGPLHLGQLSRVNEHAVVKSGVSIGPLSKVGGEVEASVIEGYSSKQHTGYLGHSYLGQWVNLGAGTSNSNLKNTYGSVRIEVGTRKIDTGLQFFGCVVGDLSRSAINTSIFTGKLVGVCSTLYGFVTTNVPSFVNYARSFGEVTDMKPAVVAELQRRVFLRRGIVQQPWHRHLLDAVYGPISAGRQLADRPVSL